MSNDGTELLRRMAGGDRDAFATFYDAYAPLAFGLIRRILRNAAEAEEVFQEVFWRSGSRRPTTTPSAAARRPGW